MSEFEVDKEAVQAFIELMERETIPQIVEIIYQRQLAARKYLENNPWM